LTALFDPPGLSRHAALVIVHAVVDDALSPDLLDEPS